MKLLKLKIKMKNCNTYNRPLLLKKIQLNNLFKKN